MTEARRDAQLRLLTHPALMLALLATQVVIMLHACWNSPANRMDDREHLRPAMIGTWRDGFRLRPELSEPYIPVTFFSYRLDLMLFGLEPERRENAGPGTAMERVHSSSGSAAENSIPRVPGMRVMNALYHVLAGFFLWMLLLRLGAGVGLAAIVALVWTGHPMALESAAWISERKNVLAGMFGFATLLAWTADRQRIWRWPLVYVLYTLAVLSKPSALGILPVLIGLELFDPIGRAFHFRRAGDWIALSKRMVIPILISVAGSWATLQSVGRELVLPPGGSVWTALLTDVEIFGRYIGNILAPINLSFFYAVEPIRSPGDPRLWLYGAMLVAVCGGSIWAAGPPYRRLAALGVFWFFGALGPNANLVGIPFWMQDRYAYLSAAGLLLAVGAGLMGLAQRLRISDSNWTRIAWAWPVAIALAAGVRSPLFADVNRLILDAVERQPGSAMARLCAAMLCKERFHRYSVNGEQPNPRLAEISGKTAIDLYSNIEYCADLYAHIDTFTLRVKRAELLPLLGRLDDARALLGKVPPPDVKMLLEFGPNGERLVRSRRDEYSGYPPRSLAAAYAILGEIHLRQSAGSQTGIDERIALAALAEKNAAGAIGVHPREFEAHILKTRALFRLAELFTEKGDLASAVTCQQNGLAAMSRVPRTPLVLKMAKRQGLDLNALPHRPGE